MKLNLKKKKKKDKEPSLLVKLAKQADNLAKLYKKWHVVAANAESQKKEANELIKDLAAKSGITMGKETVVEGKHFIVGYSTITPVEIDATEAKLLLPDDVYESLLVKEIDANKFQLAVDDGRIDRAIAAKILKNGTPTKRILIKERKA